MSVVQIDFSPDTVESLRAECERRAHKRGCAAAAAGVLQMSDDDDYHGDFQVPPAGYGHTWDSDPRTAALRAALDAALTKEIGNERLIDVMRRRYGRECEQWKANHDERKRERDALRAEIDWLKAQPFVPASDYARSQAALKQALETIDAMAGERERQADKRQAVIARRALASLSALLKLFDGREMTTHAEQAALREARAVIAEAGR